MQNRRFWVKVFATATAIFWTLFILHGFVRERAAHAIKAGSADGVQRTD